ncbi:MAG: hypothetical protein IJA32_03390 [Lachnospiraceae bacterium]|nr:hypothetical protein [Lachnospiraceae bacterium]
MAKDESYIKENHIIHTIVFSESFKASEHIIFVMNSENSCFYFKINKKSRRFSETEID